MQVETARWDPETPVPARPQGLDFLHIPGCTGATLTGGPPPQGKGKCEEGDGQRMIHPHSINFRLFHFWSPPNQSWHPEMPTLPRSLPSARNSQLQDTLPGRQAPCTQDASSMSSPLSLAAEHRADGHSLAATLQTHTQTRGTATHRHAVGVQANGIPAVIQEHIPCILLEGLL